MRVLIVEDETAAYENLVKILAEIDSEIEVIGNTESVHQTVRWLSSEAKPDLIFMDIHLSDGSAFNIFASITVETPIIFTTAYDEYAIDAFKVNSIDYLLKPINIEELKSALSKFRKWGRQDLDTYFTKLTKLVSSDTYSERILLPLNDRLLPINVNEIAFFYTSNNNTSVTLKNGKRYNYSKRLDNIIETLNPNVFYRANKQFVIAKSCISEIVIWFDSRLLVRLNVDTPERVYVSKNKASDFKRWVL